ncbi:hypothetical protein NKI86_31575 [Mesorhizobium sp. M0320]|uniref:CocE/NonD family hydrolase C-terminal non-catalytic domain-containing protein n=1 Tax=Mesorhizobium sp. M0320 TaxID=2956936 RepID=UPI00333907CC
MSWNFKEFRMPLDAQFTEADMVREISYAISEMTLLGNPEITLYLSIDNGDDADLELTLKDVDPEGNVLFLQSGLLRASLVHLFRRLEKLVPGETYEVRMSLLAPIAHVVRQGHSLEFTIGAPNPIPHPNVGSMPVGAPSINRVITRSDILLKFSFPFSLAQWPKHRRSNAASCGISLVERELNSCPGTADSVTSPPVPGRAQFAILKTATYRDH